LWKCEGISRRERSDHGFTQPKNAKEKPRLVWKYFPGQCAQIFERTLLYLDIIHPVVLWMTINYKFPSDTTIFIQGDQKVSLHLTITVQNNTHTIDDLKMAITEYIRTVDRAILNTVFENTVRRVNKCLETGRGHFERYL